MSAADILTTISIPRFVRFKSVRICYNNAYKSNEKKRETCEALLHRLKPNIFCSRLEFLAEIDELEPSFFPKSSILLDHIRNKLLPNFNDCRQYEFSVEFCSEKETVAEFIASLLQMEPIRLSSSVSLCLIGSRSPPVRLPIKIIENWLISGNYDQICDNRQITEMVERVLRVKMDAFQMLNKLEFLDHMIKVFKYINSIKYSIEFVFTHFSHYQIRVFSLSIFFTLPIM